jgi:hypothetical protein
MKEKGGLMTVVTHLTILDQSEGNVLGVRLQGRLRDEDLRGFAEELSARASAHGRLRLLLEFKTLKGVTPNELWEDMRLSTPQIQEVDCLALVCDDEDYRRWMAALSSALIEGEVQYFQPSDLKLAWEWVKDR